MLLQFRSRAASAAFSAKAKGIKDTPRKEGAKLWAFFAVKAPVLAHACERKEKANKFIAKALDVFFQSRRFFFFPLVLSLLLFDARFAHSFHFFFAQQHENGGGFFFSCHATYIRDSVCC